MQEGISTVTKTTATLETRNYLEQTVVVPWHYGGTLQNYMLWLSHGRSRNKMKLQQLTQPTFFHTSEREQEKWFIHSTVWTFPGLHFQALGTEISAITLCCSHVFVYWDSFCWSHSIFQESVRLAETFFRHLFSEILLSAWNVLGKVTQNSSAQIPKVYWVVSEGSALRSAS